MDFKNTTKEAVELLKRLIATPSVSREEKDAADIIEDYLKEKGCNPERHGNNVWAKSLNFDESVPAILLNAHIDTVKPVAGWTHDPFKPEIEIIGECREKADAESQTEKVSADVPSDTSTDNDSSSAKDNAEGTGKVESSSADEKLFGLGSNDCGGGLMALLQVFLLLRESNPNLIYLASCEEEVSGKNGIESVLPLLPPVEFAIVGEPTGMQPAIAEKGLMVVDAVAKGQSGHAARDEGVNAIYEAIDDIQKIQTNHLRKQSPLLGPVKMTVTMISAGTQHNVIPDECHFTIDIRSNECYTNEELFAMLQKHLKSELKARSFRLNSSSISTDHPFVRKCVERGMVPFGSPTLSDQALMPFPSLKLGPGQSSRSHTADEFILVSEIENAVRTYYELLQ